VALGANDNLVEESDIYRSQKGVTIPDQSSRRGDGYIPSSERDEFSSVEARRCEDIGGIENSRFKARLSHLGHKDDGPNKSWRRRVNPG
jgi:hypothetical protein